MSPFKFHTTGFQNHPSYPKQKTILKSHWGNLKIRNNINFGIFMPGNSSHRCHFQPRWITLDQVEPRYCCWDFQSCQNFNFSAMQEWLDLGGGWLQFLHLKKLEKRWKNHQNPTVGCWDTTFCPPLPQFWCLSIGFDREPPEKPLFLIFVTFLTKNGFWWPFDTFAMKCWQNQSPRVVGQADDYGNAVMHPCYDATSQNRWIRLKFGIWDLAPKIT